MHAVLLHAVTANPDISLRLGCGLDLFRQDDAGVRVTLQDGAHLAADLLVGADGLWSRVRQQLLADGQPQATGHVAYRTLLTQADLKLRSQIAQRRGADANVDRDRPRRAERLHLARLHRAQQPRLVLRVQLRDLVEEQGAAVGRLEIPRRVGDGPRVGAAARAEEARGENARIVEHEAIAGVEE